ncbi:MAG: AEC family transporter [Sphaerochaetaceae bacterium]|nr:AEC family transporter [Sphaerochaetaceae bacterium]
MGIAVEVVMTMMILLCIGYFIYDKPWAGETAVTMISKLLLNICLPSMLLYSMVNSVSHDQLISFGILLPITVLLIVFLFYFSLLIAKLFKVDKGRQGVFATMGSLSNTIFLGLPVCTMIFGFESVPLVMLGFISGSIVTFTLGLSGIMKDATYLGEQNANLTLKDQLRNMFLNPIMVSLFVGLLLNLLNVKYFPSLNTALGYISNMTTPLSLIFIGMYMRTMNLKDFIPDKDSILVLIIRFIFAPVLAYLFYKGFTLIGVNIDQYSIDVLVIQVACCVLTMTSIFAIEYKADGKFATKTVAISNLIFLFFLPIYIMVLV